MRSRSAVWVGFSLALAWLSQSWAQESPTLQAKVQSLYDQSNAMYRAKNAESLMSLLTDDFQVIMAGLDREGVEKQLRSLLQSYEELEEKDTLISITPSGRYFKVVRDSKLSGRTGSGDRKEIASKSGIDYLIEEGGSLKIARTAEIDKPRLSLINGPHYKDEDGGFSFTAPDSWDVIPGLHPLMKGTILALAPDKTSVALIGYLKTPGITAQEAAEGDEAVTKALSNPDTYQSLKSEPIHIGPFEGYETESKFSLPNAQDRHRRRVYFKAHGNLYVLCFDAIPYSQWDSVRGGFQQILESIEVQD